MGKDVLIGNRLAIGWHAYTSLQVDYSEKEGRRCEIPTRERENLFFLKRRDPHEKKNNKKTKKMRFPMLLHGTYD